MGIFMQIFLVGGAVRDQLLGQPVTERDWVVVGAEAKDLLAQGYQQVGRDFPVFLHPKTREEYALARTERKTGKGYTGFSFDANKAVTLEEDLCRRDLTINAMAQTVDGQLIDPYGGQADLKNKYLRHVSPAFIEDPVRILRVARFAARFAELGFHVVSETNALMQKMVALGEIDMLVPERIWKEFERALKENHPETFFMVLEECHALNILFPNLFMSGSVGIQALKNATQLSSQPVIRFAALLHDQSIVTIQQFSKKYRIPVAFAELAKLVAQYQRHYVNVSHLSAEEIIDLLQHVDAFRRPERFRNWLIACTACTAATKPADQLIKYLKLANSIETLSIAANAQGKEIGERIRLARIEKIHDLTSQKR